MKSVEKIINSSDGGADLVKFAESVGERLKKDNLKRTQIRNTFTEVRQIEAIWSTKPKEAQLRLSMLKPKIEYQNKRFMKRRRSPVQELRKVVIGAIEAIEKAKDEKTRNDRFKRFAKLFEAILAYHYAKGGK